MGYAGREADAVAPGHTFEDHALQRFAAAHHSGPVNHREYLFHAVGSKHFRHEGRNCIHRAVGSVVVGGCAGELYVAR